MKPRAYTEEEIREKFLRHAWEIIDFWNNNTPHRTTREKIAGAVFSILSTLDGNSTILPAFMIIPAPHPADENYHRERGENWFPKVSAEIEEQLCDITNGTSDGLHGDFHQYDPSDVL
jgi:hypothetical protein